MKKFKAVKVTDNEIVLEDEDKLKALFETINNGTEFILEWPDPKRGDNVLNLEIMLSTNLLSKVKTGELKLKAINKK